jgi:hypothetical protein
MKERGKVIFKFVIEGSALLGGGEEEEDFNFGIVHLSADYFMKRELLVSLGFDLLELLLGQGSPIG